MDGEIKKIIKKETGDWYDYSAIDKLNCQYNFIIGERSNGKTYGALLKVIKKFLEK